MTLHWPETAFEEVTLGQCRPHHLDGEFQTLDPRDPRPPELAILPHIVPFSAPARGEQAAITWSYGLLATTSNVVTG